jgi:hypothetical protein
MGDDPLEVLGKSMRAIVSRLVRVSKLSVFSGDYTSCTPLLEFGADFLSTMDREQLFKLSVELNKILLQNPEVEEMIKTKQPAALERINPFSHMVDRHAEMCKKAGLTKEKIGAMVAMVGDTRAESGTFKSMWVNMGSMVDCIKDGAALAQS